MTEEEWLTSKDMGEVLVVLRRLRADAFTDRKTRLLMCGCARLKWDLLTDPCSRKAVEAAERYADGSLSLSQMLKRQRVARDASYRSSAYQASKEARLVACAAAEATRTHVNLFHARQAVGDALGCILARDLFGNPFRSVIFQPAWRTSNVVALARSIYDEREFDLLPILGDALEDAGCVDQQFLDHCRGSGPHVRGCWVVDRVLGKE
jgi:hypothetical protein